PRSSYEAAGWMPYLQPYHLRHLSEDQERVLGERLAHFTSPQHLIDCPRSPRQYRQTGLQSSSAFFTQNNALPLRYNRQPSHSILARQPTSSASSIPRPYPQWPPTRMYHRAGDIYRRPHPQFSQVFYERPWL